jgi:hypothetical protein
MSVIIFHYNADQLPCANGICPSRYLIIDESDGREEAKRQGLRVIGTLRVLGPLL